MKKILITGVAGFIGSNLAEKLLDKHYHVIGIDNLAYGVKEQVPDGVEFYKTDIRSKDIYPLFKDVDCAFHLAAKNCIADCQKDPVETLDINVTGTVNVFEAARLSGAKKIIYAESSAIYEGSNIFPTPETEERPVSMYARSKLAVSHFAKAYLTAYGVNSTGLRYFNVYGPRQDYRRTIPPVMCAFIIALLKNERPIIYGSGEKRRDFIYIDDVNEFHLLMINNENGNNRIYNLGSGVNYSINEIYAMIRGLLGRDIQPIYTKDLPCEAEITLADFTKARSFGWEPKVNLEEGIRQSIEYIKRNVIGNLK